MRDLLDSLLEPGGLSVVFQPVLEIHGGAVGLHGFECLTRGPKGTNLERADILFDYVRRKREECVVDRACLRAALAEARHLDGRPRISVNVHASTLGRDPDFPSFLAHAAEGCAIPLSRLTVEIVEHAPPWNGPGFQRALRNLRSLGASIALDDIGLGQSNYRMILDCDPEYFKIDRYLTSGCHRDSHRLAVLESIRRLADQFGGRAVAEGIDDTADLRAVTALGIDLIQGDLFFAAQPLARIIESSLLSPAPAATTRAVH